MSAETEKGIWCLVANVVADQIFGADHHHRRGTKHFAPNTKVYCFPSRWGDGYESITVIGRHRGSPKFATMVIERKRLTNWRAKVVYHPYVVGQIGAGWTQEWAEYYARWMCFREQSDHAMRVGFDAPDPNDALLCAADLGLPEAIQQALAWGADINVHGIRGFTPLMLAVCRWQGPAEAVQILLDQGADQFATNDQGATALDLLREMDRPWHDEWRAQILHLLERRQG